SIVAQPDQAVTSTGFTATFPAYSITLMVLPRGGPTPTLSNTRTLTNTATRTATRTSTAIPSATSTPTSTQTPTATYTASLMSTPSQTSTAFPGVLWVDDALPTGAVIGGADGWNWITSNPAPDSGTRAHQ